MPFLIFMTALIIWRTLPRLLQERKPREIAAVCLISAIAMYYALCVAIRVNSYSPVEALMVWLHDDLSIGYVDS
ncbi:MAG: hypothetical protein LBM98_04375 [Oscillospiraceae bacterium]|jgi:hypothetical protein|nr:hypothetical protein [Oscillospiraceae bacterium]